MWFGVGKTGSFVVGPTCGLSVDLIALETSDVVWDDGWSFSGSSNTGHLGYSLISGHGALA